MKTSLIKPKAVLGEFFAEPSTLEEHYYGVATPQKLFFHIMYESRGYRKVVISAIKVWDKKKLFSILDVCLNKLSVYENLEIYLDQ